MQFTGTPLELPNISCHSHAVEREVKLTTECSAAVLGIDNQQGFAFSVCSLWKESNSIRTDCKKKQKSHKKTITEPELPRGDRTLNINVANICTSTTKLRIMR